MMSFREWILLREGVIKTPLPDMPQEYTFSCGAAALRSILHYYGIERSEEVVRKVAKTTESHGTRTEDLIRAARYFGLKTKAQYNMDAQDLKDLLDEEKPVIVCFQAWGTKKYYKTKQSGHYAVAIGYDDKNLYFQDSNMNKSKKSKSRGHISWSEFITRWRDQDSESNERNRYGIAVWKEKPRRKKTEKIKSSKPIK